MPTRCRSFSPPSLTLHLSCCVLLLSYLGIVYSDSIFIAVWQMPRLGSWYLCRSLRLCCMQHVEHLSAFLLLTAGERLDPQAQLIMAAAALFPHGFWQVSPCRLNNANSCLSLAQLTTGTLCVCSTVNHRDTVCAWFVTASFVLYVLAFTCSDTALLN